MNGKLAEEWCHFNEISGRCVKPDFCQTKDVIEAGNSILN